MLLSRDATAAWSAAGGELYSFGWGWYGLLGHGDEQHQLWPKLVESLGRGKVVQASAGYEHSLVVTEEGKLYSFGFGGAGQLGHGDERDQLRPKLVEGLGAGRVVQASAGGQHSLVVTQEGKLYSFGYGGYGRLGHGDERDQLQPKLVAGLGEGKVVQVSAGNQHSLALVETAAGHSVIFSWGGGRAADDVPSGQHGHGDPLQRTVPTLIDALLVH